MPEPRLPDDLLRVLTRVTDPAELSALLTDLMTPSEIEAIAERWEIVRLLSEGHSQRAVRDVLGCSVTTVSRGNRQLRYGTGAIARALARAKEE